MKTLLKFEADWCGPCQQVKPIVEDVLAERDNVTLEVINIDDEANLPFVHAHGVRAVPTFVLKDGDKVVDVTTGAM